uniref:Uncharacterized protein n=1 Tax=Candidatus Methanophaga sp. ANME-1 ERB7 TaxID=2759913 RepID=A0A7G9Z1M8_9EURY|nr:hypothetical protein LIOOIKKA_00004 [Methanosarcinales archaeon ANME-1 ERB7]
MYSADYDLVDGLEPTERLKYDRGMAYQQPWPICVWLYEYLRV